MAIEAMRMCRVWLDELLSMFSDVHANELFEYMQLVTVHVLQCYHTVGWASGRASSLYKIEC